MPALRSRVPAPKAGVLAAQITTAGAARTSVAVLAILLAAIACFSVAAMPAARLPWRGGKTLVLYHRAAVTAAGAVLLIGAGAYVLTR